VAQRRSAGDGGGGLRQPRGGGSIGYYDIGIGYMYGLYT